MRSLRGRSEQSNDIGESHVHVQSLESSNAGRANRKEDSRSLWRSEHIRTRSSLTTHRGCQVIMFSHLTPGTSKDVESYLEQKRGDTKSEYGERRKISVTSNRTITFIAYLTDFSRLST